MEEDTICKEGIVRAVNGENVEVEIIVQSACSGCHAKSICMPSDKRNETVTAKNVYGIALGTGDKVQLAMKTSSGNKAVMWAYVLPFVVLMSALFGMYAITRNELLSVIVSLSLVVAYYFALKKRNRKFEKEFQLHIKSKLPE